METIQQILPALGVMMHHKDTDVSKGVFERGRGRKKLAEGRRFVSQQGPAPTD